MRSRKKKRQHRFINGAKGVISLFLCVVITPILFVASMLVEFSRYQGTASIAEELMDASILSTLGNYDKYIEDRFGLFSVSQDCDIQTTYSELYSNNAKILGNAIDPSTVSAAYGTDVLSDIEVLEQQILDFSESTVLTEMLLEDLNLQEILDKLESLTKITNIFAKISKMKTLIEAVEAMVNSGEALVAKVQGIRDTITNIQTDATALSDSVAELYKKLMSDTKFSASLPKDEEETEEDESEDQEIGEASLKIIVEGYIDDIKNIYQNAQDLYNNIIALQSTVTDDIPALLETFKTDVNKARTALNDVLGTDKVKTGSDEETEEKSTEEKTTEKSLSILGTLITSIETTLENAVQTLGNDALVALKTAANSVIDTAKESLGLDELETILDAETYTWENVKETTKENLKLLLSKLDYESWDSSETAMTDLKEQIKEVFLPNILKTNSYDEVFNTLNRAIETAKNKFVSDITDSITTVLKNLVDSLNSLFKLDVFYDANLCAYVVGGTDNAYSPYQGFLNALQEVMDAQDKIQNGDFFKKLEGLKNMFIAVGEAGNAIWGLISDTIGQIKEFMGYIEDPQQLYKMLLVSGYAVHNFPNRTDAGTKTLLDDLSAYEIPLSGTSITGYEYKNLSRPTISASISDPQQTGITGLLNSLKANSAGLETQQTFIGAELEYILGGTSSEIANQSIVFMQIYMLRLLLDIAAVFIDSNVAAMAAATGPAAFVVYILVLLGEPLIDTIFLVNGGNAPLIKTSCYLTPMGIPKMASQLLSLTVKNEKLNKQISESNFEETLTNSFNSFINSDSYTPFNDDGTFDMEYETHCLLLLMAMTKKKDVLYRISNLIYYESRYYYEKAGASYAFDMAKTYTSITATTDVKFNSFIGVFQFNDDSFMKAKFSVTRGY